jgi:heme/copper-type cytochrome/quinol oxidase subunit 1
MVRGTASVARRVVGVVALAAVLWLVGAYLTSPAGRPITGWTGYAPLSVVPMAPRDGLEPLANLFVWFGLVLAWLAGSLVILRPGVQRRRDTDRPPPGPGAVDAGARAAGD